MWLLFRRFFIGQHYLQQRESIRQACISRSKDMEHAKVDIADAYEAFSRRNSGKRFAVQHAVPLVFAGVFAAWTYRYVECASMGKCMPHGSASAPLSIGMWLTVLALVVTGGLLMRDFRDKFHIASEFRRVAALSVFLFLPLIVALRCTGVDISFQFVLCFSQVSSCLLNTKRASTCRF